jgi:hypothetical protein
VRAIQAHALLDVAVAGQEFESLFDEKPPDPSGMRLDWSEVDALVVSGVERAGFFRFEGEIAEALTGTHFPWAQDQVIGVNGADRAPGIWRGRA